MNLWFRLIVASPIRECWQSPEIAQQRGQSALPAAHSAVHLQITKTIKTTEIARVFELPLKCDDDAGNVFLKTDVDGFPSIHKITACRDHVATYAVNSCPDVKVQIGPLAESDPAPLMTLRQ